MTDTDHEAAALDAERAKPPNPLRDRPFRWFFIGRAASLFGGSMTSVALAFAVLQRTSDPHWLGYVLAAQMTPMIALLILGGGLADRYRRDRLLRLANLSAGLTQAFVAFVVLSGASLWLLLPASVLNGVAEAFTTPALRGIVPELVAPGAIQRANSMLASTRNAAKVLGPSLAGVLAAGIGGGWGIACDAAGFVVSAACLTQVRLPARQSGTSRRLPAELREGWQYFRSLPWVWSITATFTVFNLIQVGSWQVLGPSIVKHSMGAAGWGAANSAKAVGLLLLSLVMLRLTVRRPLVVAMAAAALSGLPLVLLGLHAGLVPLAAATFTAGAGSAVCGILWDSTLQTGIPTELISRVTSYDDFGSWVAIPVGQLGVIPLAAAFGAGRVAVAGGIALTGLTLLPLLVPSVRGRQLAPAS
ncbi:MFS family permease [Kitasatospora sp. GP30]|uniref:MFS transporter n=1 Tax=Kitasatospora sp. GP30 TaxID=3035084 RepID=UPI000C70A71C|nr:MFS transporter [Kitasatospora sp. GP30]MDH6144868.1 MFS family permease [Kitasatospora sp. GP30]